MRVHPAPEGNLLVQEEGKQRRQRDRKAFGYQWIPVTEIDAQVQNNRTECQADDLYQIESCETEKRPVFFLEIEVPVKHETANNTTMETDDVGPKVGYILEQQGKNQKLYSSADDTEEAIEDEVPVFAIELP